MFSKNPELVNSHVKSETHVKSLNPMNANSFDKDLTLYVKLPISRGRKFEPNQLSHPTHPLKNPAQQPGKLTGSYWVAH